MVFYHFSNFNVILHHGYSVYKVQYKYMQAENYITSPPVRIKPRQVSLSATENPEDESGEGVEGWCFTASFDCHSPAAQRAERSGSGFAPEPLSYLWNIDLEAQHAEPRPCHVVKCGNCNDWESRVGLERWGFGARLISWELLLLLLRVSGQHSHRLQAAALPLTAPVKCTTSVCSE